MSLLIVDFFNLNIGEVSKARLEVRPNIIAVLYFFAIKNIWHDPFAVDFIHNNEKSGNGFKLIEFVIMVNIVPVVIKKGEEGYQEFQQASDHWHRVECHRGLC